MLKLEHLRQPFLLSCEMHFLNSCTKFCTKPIFRVFSFIFECLKKQKIRTPKSAENPCKIKKIGRFIIFRFLDTDYNLDTTADAVQKAVRTMTLNFLRIMNC